jgi:hypothetical protein
MHLRDRLGALMLAGGVLGFAAGAVIGLHSDALAAPVLMPFVGALVVDLLIAVIALALGEMTHRRDIRELDAVHDQIRTDAHTGWLDGIDLMSDAPPRPRHPFR